MNIMPQITLNNRSNSFFQTKIIKISHPDPVFVPPQLSTKLLTQQILTTHSMQLTDKVTELQADLARARSEHYRLVWLAGGTDAERSALLRGIADAEDGVFVELGKKLSEALIEVPAPLRTASVEECFTACLGGFSCPVTCLNHLEILFEPNLRINPVTLIKSASRHALIVAAWPGNFDSDRLRFGSPDHPGYMELSKQDLEAIVHFI